jgi:hypothetical protein
MADLIAQHSKESDDFKKNQSELYRKLEQRCFRLDNEKQALRRQHEKELEDLRVQHKQDIQQIHEKRMRSTEDVRKDCENKVYIYINPS